MLSLILLFLFVLFRCTFYFIWIFVVAFRGDVSAYIALFLAVLFRVRALLYLICKAKTTIVVVHSGYTYNNNNNTYTARRIATHHALASARANTQERNKNI